MVHVEDSSTEVLDLPTDLTVYVINEDGTRTLSISPFCSVYIDEKQVHKIWDREVAKYIRNTYGPCIGVMHFNRGKTVVPPCETHKYVLGG